MSFIEEIKGAIDKAELGATTDPARSYRTILDELAEGLNGRGVGARIIVSPRDPRQLTLYVHPLYRPNPGSPMLRFFLEGDEVVVSGESPTRIPTPEALKQWLLQFVALPTFVESLHILREKTSEPVEARLRVSLELAYAKGDILVAVTPEDQQKLAEAAENAQRALAAKQTPDLKVEFDVKRIDFPGNADFDEGTSYAALDSAGHGLAVDKVTRVGDKLRVTGRLGWESTSMPGHA